MSPMFGIALKYLLTLTGSMTQKASESAAEKLGEKITEHLLQKYPTFAQQLQTAKQAPSEANQTELAQKFAIKAEDDTQLTKLISELTAELKKTEPHIDNRKIIHGNDYSGNFTAGRDMHLGDNIAQKESLDADS